MALAHRVVLAHGGPLAQIVLVQQLALLERLDQDGGLLIKLTGTAAWGVHLNRVPKL